MYSYDAENTLFFKTCNLVAGFMQRADATRRWAFGVMNVCGVDEDTAPFRVSGCWLFRGTDIIADMQAVDDFEYFKWSKGW